MVPKPMFDLIIGFLEGSFFFTLNPLVSQSKQKWSLHSFIYNGQWIWPFPSSLFFPLVVLKMTWYIGPAPLILTNTITMLHPHGKTYYEKFFFWVQIGYETRGVWSVSKPSKRVLDGRDLRERRVGVRLTRRGGVRIWTVLNMFGRLKWEHHMSHALFAPKYFSKY